MNFILTETVRRHWQEFGAPADLQTVVNQLRDPEQYGTRFMFRHPDYPDRAFISVFEEGRYVLIAFGYRGRKLSTDRAEFEEWFAALPDVPDTVEALLSRRAALIKKTGQYGTHSWINCKIAEINERFAKCEGPTLSRIAGGSKWVLRGIVREDQLEDVCRALEIECPM